LSKTLTLSSSASLVEPSEADHEIVGLFLDGLGTHHIALSIHHSGLGNHAVHQAPFLIGLENRGVKFVSNDRNFLKIPTI
jgi:hypothetical protein